MRQPRREMDAAHSVTSRRQREVQCGQSSQYSLQPRLRLTSSIFANFEHKTTYQATKHSSHSMPPLSQSQQPSAWPGPAWWQLSSAAAQAKQASPAAPPPSAALAGLRQRGQRWRWGARGPPAGRHILQLRPGAQPSSERRCGARKGRLMAMLAVPTLRKLRLPDATMNSAQGRHHRRCGSHHLLHQLDGQRRLRREDCAAPARHARLCQAVPGWNGWPAGKVMPAAATLAAQAQGRRGPSRRRPAARRSRLCRLGQQQCK